MATHYKNENQEFTLNHYKDQDVAKYMKGLVIQQLESKNSKLTIIDEVVLEGCFEAVTHFSKSGKLFCFLNKTTSVLKIFSIDTDNPRELISEIRDDKHIFISKHSGC